MGGRLDTPHPSGDSIIYTNLLNYYLGSVQSSIITNDWSYSDTLNTIKKISKRKWKESNTVKFQDSI